MPIVNTQKQLPKTVSKYAEYTVAFILTLLAEAYQNEDKLDKILAKLSDDIFNNIIKLLKQIGDKKNIDLFNEKINLSNYPELYRILRNAEQEQLHNFTTYWWMAEQVLSESLTKTYRETVLETYKIYNYQIPDLTEKIYITDNYIKENILQIPWCKDGKTYSERLYKNVANFQSKLAFVLEEGITKGKGMDWMKRSWQKLTHSTAQNTARLLKTETMAMWSEATKTSLLDMGVEYVEIVGDALCGAICLDYMGEPILLKDAEIGGLLPPYHPNCACSYVIYEDVGEEY